ncbi:hypothetical protein, partial [Achromobacter xylosoxidans]|uniref:hypothetical protein n=1 Tax=Alcaligenes xylosoxydans xylosoxydans TaxID=85698 RepID=UPI001ED96D7B
GHLLRRQVAGGKDHRPVAADLMQPGLLRQGGAPRVIRDETPLLGGRVPVSRAPLKRETHHPDFSAHPRILLPAPGTQGLAGAGDWPGASRVLGAGAHRVDAADERG